MQKDTIEDKPLFSEKWQTYALNFLMCFNGGIIASYSYSYASILATAITGGYIKVFHHIFDGLYPLSIAFGVTCIVFILGLLFTILLKQKVKSQKKIIILSLIVMILCYIAQICLKRYTDLSLDLKRTGWLYYLLPIFFSSAIQYNTFGFMDGVQAATMFVTNNVRQTFVRLINSKVEKDKKLKIQGLLYLFSLICFTVGLVVGFPLYNIIDIKMLYISVCICTVSIAIKAFEQNQ